MRKRVISRTKAIMVLFMILLVVAGCGDGKEIIVKDGLEGIWKTNHPTYKDCSLGLTKDLIIFTSGYNLDVLDAFLLNHIDVNFITKINKKVEKARVEKDKVEKDKDKEKDKEKDKILYTVYYENMNKQKCTFPFYFDPSDEGMIAFKNQPQMKWKKEGTMIIEKNPERPK